MVLLGGRRPRRSAPTTTALAGSGRRGRRRWTVAYKEQHKPESAFQLPIITNYTYRSQQHRADILRRSSAPVAAGLGPLMQPVGGYAAVAADPGGQEREGQVRDHYLLDWP